MQFNQNATIISADSKEVGHLERVVIDPETKALTHIVIHKGLLNAKDKVVPVDRIAAALTRQRSNNCRTMITHDMNRS